MDQHLDLRSLPRPTDEQFAAFAEHVGDAHSWYKHLPLLTGNQFVVFVSPDSGVGRLEARFTAAGLELVTPPEGPVFTEENPRLHYSWKTSEEYRRRFGYLDYARNCHGGFVRDAGGEMYLPDEVMKRCSFTLFPSVASGDSGRDSVGWAHEEAIAELRAGAAHPKKDVLLEWARLYREHDTAWQNLTDAERDNVMARYREEPPPEPTAAVSRYLAIESELETLYNEQLRSGEVAKISWALDELRAWLDGR